MKKVFLQQALILGFLGFWTSSITGNAADATTGAQPIKIRSATASSILNNATADKAIDGVIKDNSRWVAQKIADPQWMELDLGGVQHLAGIHLYSGYKGADPIQNFVVQFWRDGKWQDVPSAEIVNNKSSALALAFDGTVEVTTDRLRIYITAPSKGIAQITEVVVWPASVGTIPPLAANSSAGEKPLQNEPVPLIYLNQSGFNLGKPKRFTAPTVAPGTKFEVRPAQGGPAVFTGTIDDKNIGDFTKFNPADGLEYVVVAGTNTSVPFRIGQWWLERVTYQGAVDFMIDSRHYLGTHRASCRLSYGWRDDHHFGWELNTLVPQFLSNPSAYERMPRQIKYENSKDPKIWGALEPYREDAPDIVKLIHWGADVIVTQKLTHELMKAQLAYFLYAWPSLKDYLPAQNYEVVRDYAFQNWRGDTADQKYPYDESEGHNLLALKTKVGTTKGGLPPGFSIEPNLLLFEVAKREKRPDAEKYFQAAYNQAEWIIANLNWDYPLTTKGQRMSEFITMTGLAHLLREYPGRAPAGLKEKINEWAAVVVRRSDNLWDFRKLDDGDRWVPKGEKPTMWNEPGNVAGLPTALLAAKPFLTDPATKARVDQLIWSHFDNMFGRNPTGRHFSFDAPREIEGVEHGWFTYYQGGNGQLSKARFVLDGSPKNDHFPYSPEKGNIGWTEGWIQHNTPFNAGLAYLARAETQVSLRREGDELVVRLRAPLNFDYTKAESGTVWVTSSSGDSERLVVTEESANSEFLSGRMKLQPSATAKPGDGLLQVVPGAKIQAGYGFGFMGRQAAIPF